MYAIVIDFLKTLRPDFNDGGLIFLVWADGKYRVSWGGARIWAVLWNRAKMKTKFFS